MNSYNEKVNFYIPGAFAQPFTVLNYVFENFKTNKEMFKDNVKISCLYGAPACIWNGGRVIL